MILMFVCSVNVKQSGCIKMHACPNINRYCNGWLWNIWSTLLLTSVDWRGGERYNCHALNDKLTEFFLSIIKLSGGFQVCKFVLNKWQIKFNSNHVDVIHIMLRELCTTIMGCWLAMTVRKRPSNRDWYNKPLICIQLYCCKHLDCITASASVHILESARADFDSIRKLQLQSHIYQVMCRHQTP